jgi:hypothetical protein
VAERKRAISGDGDGFAVDVTADSLRAAADEGVGRTSTAFRGAPLDELAERGRKGSDPDGGRN